MRAKRVLPAVIPLFAATAAPAATVTFGTPDLLVVPDGGTSNWNAKVPAVAPALGWSETASYHAINTKGTGAQNGRIVPTSTAHAINTKGTGCNNGFVFAGGTTPGGAAGSISVQARGVAPDGNGGYAFTFDELFAVPGTADAYVPIVITLDGLPLNGATLVGLPTATVSADRTGINLDETVVPPAGATPDTETFGWTISAATAVPEPAGVAVIAASLAGVARRRRR